MIKDPYTDTQRCVDKLLDVYRTHGSIIIAVDFDDTIFDFHKKGFKFPRVEQVLKKCNALNLDIVMFTASMPIRFPFIRDYMKAHGIEIKEINKTIIPNFEFGNSGKLFYNILLDDRAGLGQSLDTLETFIETIKTKET